jgi:hypothetical protein
MLILQVCPFLLLLWAFGHSLRCSSLSRLTTCHFALFIYCFYHYVEIVSGFEEPVSYFIRGKIV